MAHQLQTPGGKKLYALRKQVPEPVFGIIKSVLGFRQFFCCAGSTVSRGEWSLVTMAWNMEADVRPSPPPEAGRTAFSARTKMADHAGGHR